MRAAWCEIDVLRNIFLCFCFTREPWLCWHDCWKTAQALNELENPAPKMLSLPLNLPQIRRAYFVSVWHSCFFWIPHKKSCFVTQANISHKYLSIGLSVRPFSNFTGWLDSLKGLYWQIKQTRCLSRISPYMLYAQNNAYVSIYNLKLPDSW